MDRQAPGFPLALGNQIARLLSTLKAKTVGQNLGDMRLVNRLYATVSLGDTLAQVKGVSSSTVVGATGWLTVHNVPVGKRWILYLLEAVLSTGVYTFDNFRLGDPVGSTNVPFVPFAAATSKTQTTYKPLPLRSGQVIQVNISAFTTGGNIHSHIWIQESDDFEE